MQIQTMRKHTFTILVAAALGIAVNARTPEEQSPGPEPVRTSSIEEVLQSVSANNPELQAITEDTEAAALQLRAGNMPEDPTVEYSSFYSRTSTGQSGSELVVSQGFDFPTLYATRHSQNKLAVSSLNSTLVSERRRILLEAKTVCLDIIMYRQLGELLDMQEDIAGEMLELYQKRYETGDATALDLNKIKMELMNVATAVADNNASLSASTNTLTALNGDTGIIFEADFYPLVEEVTDPQAAMEEYISGNASILAAENAAQAARKQVSLEKQGWIPKIEIGYRRNTALREAENGFLVGGSIPVFSNHRKVRMAKAQSASAHNRLSMLKSTAQAEVKSFISDIQETRAALEAYDEPLMRETLSLLKEAVEGGQISVIDYFVEASNIYTNLSNCITLQNRYQKLLARLYANRL